MVIEIATGIAHITYCETQRVLNIIPPQKIYGYAAGFRDIVHCGKSVNPLPVFGRGTG